MSDMAKLEIPSIVVHNGSTGSGGGGGGGGGGSPTGSGGGVVVVVGPRSHSGGCPRAMDHEQRVGGPRSGGPSLRSLRTLSKQEEFEEEDELAVESGGLSPIECSNGGGGGWRSSRDGGSSGDERGVSSPIGATNGLVEEGNNSSRGSERRKGFQSKHSRTSSSGEDTLDLEGSTENSEGPRKSQTPIGRMRSNSKVKLLVRSHAMREETSPPPDPEAIHRYSPPNAGTVSAPPAAPTSPSALSVPPSGLLTVNVGSAGGTSRPSSRHRLRHQGSSQGSMDSSSPCLSRDSSTEQASLLDGGGSSSSGGGGSSGDLQQFIVETLNRNYKDRLLMLKIEQEIVSLTRDNKRTHHKFPPMSSYQRMLVHRVAAFFGMEHNVDSTGNAVVVSKGRQSSNGSSNSTTGGSNGGNGASYGGGSEGPNSPLGNSSSSLSPPSSSLSSKIRFPPIEPCLRDHIRDELLPEEPRRSILKRGDSSSFEDGAGPFKSPERQLSSESRRSKSFEEREEEYEKVRKRIFNQDEGICCCDASGQQRCSHEDLHCWSGVGGGNGGGGGGGGSGSGSFLHPWSSSDSSDTPHGIRGRHNQLRPSRLLKVESFESRESLRRTTSSGFRPSVSKSYSFGGYSGSVGGGSEMGGGSSSGGGAAQLTRGDSISSTHSAGGRLLTKQDSSASSANSAHLSPSSSGYKTQSVRSDSSNTPSPSPTTLPPSLTPTSQQQHSSHDRSEGPSPSPPLLSPPLHNQTHSESQTESPPIPHSPPPPPPPDPQNQQGTTTEDELPGHIRNNVCTSQTRGTSPLPQPPTDDEPRPSSSSTHCTAATSSDVIHPTVPLGNNAVMWAVTSMDSVPPGSVLINPQTGQPYVNSDGTIYRFNPSNPPKIVSATSVSNNSSVPVNIQPSSSTITATTCSKAETSSPQRPLAYVCEPALGAEVASLLMPNTQTVPGVGLQTYVPQPPAPLQQQLLTTVPQSYSNTTSMQGGGDAPGAVLGPGQPQFATPASSYNGSLLGQHNYPLQGSIPDTQKQSQDNPGIAVSELASYFMGMGLAAAAAAVANSNNGTSGNNGPICTMSGPLPSVVNPVPIAMPPTSSSVTSTTSAVGLHCPQIPPPTPPPPLPPVNPFHAVPNPSWQTSVHPQTSNVQVPFYYVAPMGMSGSGNSAVVDGGTIAGGPTSIITLPSSHTAPAAAPLSIQPPPPPPPPPPPVATIPTQQHSLPNPSLPPMQQQQHPPPGHPLGSGVVQNTSQAPCIMYQQYLQSTPPPPPPPPPIVQQVVGMSSSGTAPYSLVASAMVPPERQPLMTSRPMSHTPFTMVGGGNNCGGGGTIGNGAGGGNGICGAGGGDCFLPSPPLYSTFAAPSASSGAMPYYAQGAFQQQNLPPPPQSSQLNQHTPTSQQQQVIAGSMIGQAYHANQPTNQIRCPTPPQHLNISNQICYSQPQSQQNQIALSFLSGSSTVGNNVGSNNSGTYYAAASIQPHLLPGGPPGTPPPSGALLPTPPIHHPPANTQLNSSSLVPNPMHQQLQHHQQHHYIPPISLAPNLGLYHTNVQMVQTPPVQTPTTQHVGLPPNSATILPPHHTPHSSTCGSKATPTTKGSPSFQRPAQQFHRAISLSSGATLAGGKAIGAGEAAAFGLRFPSVHLYGVRFVPGGSGQHPALPIPGSHAVRMSPFVLHAAGPPNPPQTYSPSSNSSPSSPVILSAPNNSTSARTQRPHLTSGAPSKGRKQRTKSGASSSGGRSGSLSRQASVDSTHPPNPSVPDKDGSDGDSIPALVSSSFPVEVYTKKQNLESKETNCILTSDTAFVNGPTQVMDECKQGDRIIDWGSSRELDLSAVDQPRQPAEIKLLGCGVDMKDSVDKSLVFERECEENEGRKDS